MKRIIAINFFMMFQLSVLLFAFEEKNPKDASIEKIEKTISEALKDFENKKETYIKEVLDLFEKKELSVRNKGDLTLVNQIKKEKEAFVSQNKEPTLFFITDQKRFMEKAKIELIKNYEIAIKESIKLKLDFEAEELTKELDAIKTGKIKPAPKPTIAAKETITESKDLFQPGSFWADNQPAGMVLEVVSRKANSFSALFYNQNKSLIREVSGTIINNRINWMAKDVKVINGKSPGGNNIGTVSKNSIQMEWFTPPNKKAGDFNLTLIHPSKTFDSMVGEYKYLNGLANHWHFIKLSNEKSKNIPVIQMKKQGTEWNRFGDWGLSGNVLLLYSETNSKVKDLITLEKKTSKQIKWSVYFGECNGGFTKTYLPNRPPDRWAVFEKID